MRVDYEFLSLNPKTHQQFEDMPNSAYLLTPFNPLSTYRYHRYDFFFSKQCAILLCANFFNNTIIKDVAVPPHGSDINKDFSLNIFN